MKLIDLPHDVILLILERCPVKSLGRLRITCKAFNDLFFTPSLWKYLEVIPENKAHESFLTKLISKTKRGIKTIVASEIQTDLVTEILQTDATDIRLLNMMLLPQNPFSSKIKRLDLHSLISNSSNLSFMIGSNLTELHLLLTIVPDILMELRNCLHLTSLTLGNCSRLSNEDLSGLISRVKKWKYLALLGARNINDLILREMSSYNIHNLILHSCHLITDRGILDLAESKNLQWVKIIACRGLSLAAFDNSNFEGTMDCFMKYSDFVNGKIFFILNIS